MITLLLAATICMGSGGKGEIILFTNTKTCPGCIYLAKEMTDEKIAKLRERYVVKIYDWGTDPGNPEHRALSKKYSIQRIPTAVVNGRKLDGDDGAETFNWLRKEMNK